MNETVAALYNITDFYRGEFCWFIPVQPRQCEPRPDFTPWHKTLTFNYPLFRD